MTVLTLEIGRMTDEYHVVIPYVAPLVVQPSSPRPISLTSRCCGAIFTPSFLAGNIPAVSCSSCHTFHPIPLESAWPSLDELERYLRDQFEAYLPLAVLEPELAAYEVRKVVERLLDTTPDGPQTVTVSF